MIAIKHYKKNLTSVLIFVSLVFILPSSIALANSKMNFLVLTDLHYKKDQKTPMEIFPSNYKGHSNTLDSVTFKKMLVQIKEAIGTIIDKPNFILILGDLTGYESSATSVYNDIKDVLTEISSKFSPIPIILVFGNNDSLSTEYSPVPFLKRAYDYGPFYATTPVNGAHSTYELAMKEGGIGWRDGFLSTGADCSTAPITYPCLINKDTTYGYFAAYLAPNLRLIALNSSACDASKYNYAPQYVANLEIAWLDRELQKAATLNDSVLIVSHAPSGTNVFSGGSHWRNADTDAFHSLLYKYKNNIIGMLFGHTHMEELKVLKDTAGNAVGAEISTPALSAGHGNAPAVKTFYLSSTQGHHKKQQWSISNYKTFGFYPNPKSGDGFSLKKSGDFVSRYCPVDRQNISNIFQCLQYVTPSKVFDDNSYYNYVVGNIRFKNTTTRAHDGIYITKPNAPAVIFSK